MLVQGHDSARVSRVREESIGTFPKEYCPLTPVTPLRCAGNIFTGTSILEFSDAQGTAWLSNTFEDADPELCYKNFESSTFASTENLPPSC